ncbi:hypothetical protein NQ315_010804 [Exocentrus adspersus]|uniref:Uncharacterized protein n=1 Tax=Exocentrus adspersus TaxID=1586481 RepID=A0AAV8V9D9_9CUCU|nr:hypothetical protein NQ315_010804 [Exocentrus adspersus]
MVHVFKWKSVEIHVPLDFFMPQTTKGRPRRLASTPVTGVVDSISTDPESRPPTPLHEAELNNAGVEQIAIDTEFKPPTPVTRGRPRKQPQNVEQIPQVHSTTEKSKPTRKTRTRKVWDKDNEDVNIGVSEIPSNEAPSALDHLHHLYDGAVEPKRTRGRKRKSVHLETLNDSVEKKVPAKRGRAKKATKTQEETLTVEENDKPSLAEPTTSDEAPLTEKLRRGNNTPEVQKTEDKSNGNDRKQTAKRNKRKIASNVVEVGTKVNVRNRKKIVIEEDEE